MCLIFGCNDQKIEIRETVSKYYDARDQGNYTKLQTLISDSITITAGDYVMPYNHDSFYEQFKWDSVFKPSYRIVELEEENEGIIASVVLNSIKHEFLKNSDMICQYRISFNSGKISKIEELECKDADWATWSKEVDALVSWTKRNHPELDGFINDMTQKGAMNYLKAIELYEIREKEH